MAECLFCVMSRLSEGNHAFVPEDLCPKHLAITGIPEYFAKHPDGVCTETCGCMTLDQFNQRLEAAPPTDPPVHTLTYLARGIPIPEATADERR